MAAARGAAGKLAKKKRPDTTASTGASASPAVIRPGQVTEAGTATEWRHIHTPLPAELHQSLKDYAAARRLTIREVVAAAIEHTMSGAIDDNITALTVDGRYRRPVGRPLKSESN